MSLLNSLTRIVNKPTKRLGRGYGSGVGGHTVGRGEKGQTSRKGKNIPLWFEGGALPLNQRLPMWRGKGRFKVIHPTAELTFRDLDGLELSEITLDSLKLNKVIDKRFKQAKIIKKGKLSRKINVKGIAVSQAAKAEIEALGGSVEG